MEKNNITIVKAGIDDLDKIVKLQNNLEFKMLSENNLKEDLQNSVYSYFIACKEGTPAGFISFSNLVDTIDLDYIAVLKEYRKQKIGSKLFDKLLDFAKENNINKIMLEVRESNIVAIKFYETLGFKKIYERKNYYKDTNETAYIYEKKLESQN